MPMPTLQAAPAARSASRIRLENSSRAASYPARGVGARRLSTSRPSLSNTAISILVPPKSTPRRKVMIHSLSYRRDSSRLHGWLHEYGAKDVPYLSTVAASVSAADVESFAG